MKMSGWVGGGGNGPGRERYTLLPVSYKKITGIDFGSFSVFYEQHTQVGYDGGARGRDDGG